MQFKFPFNSTPILQVLHVLTLKHLQSSTKNVHALSKPVVKLTVSDVTNAVKL